MSIGESYGTSSERTEELIKNPSEELKEFVKEQLKYDLAVDFIVNNAK